MEQLNRVELRGVIGSAMISDVAGRRFARFTVATNLAYMSHDGFPVIETTWHNVTAWENPGKVSLDGIEKGARVYVCGRLKNNRYTTSEGEEKTVTEIIANHIGLPGDEMPLTAEESH